eukprot:TRINITY_DN55075_c0_g1_i5.p3 TRINITY_DN55075_c0_g1~~TRINITY_DN55075_c0_g1_i5.p3  ORF type:complete len:197 (-),score=25.98 TRINITY_DN55075_c0_g1_i5:330-920(-)
MATRRRRQSRSSLLVEMRGASKMIRFLAAGLAIGVASAAHADFFFIGTEGGFEVTDENGSVIDATIVTEVDTQFGGFGFEDIVGVFNADLVDDGAISGTLELLGATQDDVLTIEFAGTVDAEPGFFSYAGSWNVTDAMGAYDGLVGVGTLSGSSFFDRSDGGFASLDVQGDLVPAPATLGLLGLGGLIAARRRRQN